MQKSLWNAEPAQQPAKLIGRPTLRSHVGRPVCEFPGCKSLAVLKDYVNGKPRFRRQCALHRRGASLRPTNANTCPLCGWKGQCQRHRLVPGSQGGKYIKSNISILCPNCHAAAHGNGEWNKSQTNP